ncbi:MAG TPA: hypothetical protein VK153_02800 [Candidatus Paceibacterota bacterium]|nr:hypothetical protein [Candidatus Paceibacterota bacterium]
MVSQNEERDEETHEGYLVKYNDSYIFSDCLGDKIYVFPVTLEPKIKYENTNSSVSISILNTHKDLSLSKIEILNKQCDSNDDAQLAHDRLMGYGVMFENEAYIQDGHDLVLEQTKKIGSKTILTFQFLHYGDPFSLYQDTMTIDKGTLLDNKYEIKDINTNDIFTAEGKVAVFFSPSDTEIEEMKKNDEEGFYVGADDTMYYQSVAGEFLEKNNIKTVYTNKRYINLKRDNAEFGDEIMLDKKSLNQGWGLLLFDGKTYPVLADMVNVGPDFNKYFK